MRLCYSQFAVDGNLYKNTCTWTGLSGHYREQKANPPSDQPRLQPLWFWSGARSIFVRVAKNKKKKNSVTTVRVEELPDKVWDHVKILTSTPPFD